MRNDSLAIYMDLVNFQPLNSLITAIEFQGKQSIRVTKNLKIRKFDEATYSVFYLHPWLDVWKNPRGQMVSCEQHEKTE
jgi:hypothetical protein